MQLMHCTQWKGRTTLSMELTVCGRSQQARSSGPQTSVHEPFTHGGRWEPPEVAESPGALVQASAILPVGPLLFYVTGLHCKHCYTDYISLIMFRRLLIIKAKIVRIASQRKYDKNTERQESSGTERNVASLNLAGSVFLLLLCLCSSPYQTWP